MAGSSAITDIVATDVQRLVWESVIWLDRAAVLPLAVAVLLWLAHDLRATVRERGWWWLLTLLGLVGAGALLRLGIAAEGFFHDVHRGYSLVDGWLQAFDHGFGDRPVVRSRYGPGATAIYGPLLLSWPDERVLFSFNAWLTTLTVVPVALCARWLWPWRFSGLLAAGLYAVWPAGVRLAASEDCSNLALALAWVGLWLTASLRHRPTLGRALGAMVAISLAVQTRDSLQPLALLAVGLAIWHVGAAVPGRIWRRLALATLLFNATFLWLFVTLIVPGVARVDAFSVASQARYWAFWGWTTANPVFDSALTPALAIALGAAALIPRRWWSTVALPQGRHLLWLLVAAAVLSDMLGNLKSMSRTDAYMFHAAWMPLLFLIAEVGAARLLNSPLWQGRGRLVGAGLATALFLWPTGWQTMAEHYVDQHEWQFYRRAVDAVPRGCTLVHPMREDFTSYYHGIAHEPWLGQQRGVRMRSLRWFLSGGVHRGVGAADRWPVREPVGDCLYYMETLACAANPPQELTDLALLLGRLEAEAGALPPRGIRTLLENFMIREYRSSAGFRQPICEQLRAAVELTPVQVEAITGVGRGNSFIVARAPELGLYRMTPRSSEPAR